MGVISCSDKDEPDPPLEKERLILIYAVAANNLQGNLTSDLREILSVAPQLNLQNNIVLVYSVDYSNECKLQQLTFNSATRKYEFSTVKTFDETPLSTTSERMSEVMNYVNDNYEYPNKGLIMWSHGTGWLYWAQGEGPRNSKFRAWGEDLYNGQTYKTNIPALAEGIPSGIFDFIWFDCCYSANIETIYQLRDKSPYIIGSVIEISAAGMPYNLTMPYLLQKNSDLKGAAQAFYEYYDGYYPYAISIIKTEGLTDLSLIAGEIMSNYDAPEDFSFIQNYSILFDGSKRTTFYDLQQLLEGYEGVPEQINAKLENCILNTVIFNKISDKNWTNSYIRTPERIDVARCSGISMHNFIDNGSVSDNFYKTLDWYKATR